MFLARVEGLLLLIHVITDAQIIEGKKIGSTLLLDFAGY